MFAKQRITAFALCLFSGSLWADVIEFNNGDRLQGSIVSMQAGVLKFNAAVIGEVEIAVDKIRSFSTDEPAELHFKDGTVIKQAVQQSEAGELKVESGEVLAAQRVRLDQLAMINPPVEPPVTWEGRLTSGVTVNRGNTRSQDAYLDVNAKRETAQDRIIVDAEYYEKREENPATGDDFTSKRRQLLGGHYDYFLSPRYYVYGDVRAEKEATANLDLRLTIGAGGGYRWIKTDTTSFDVEAGFSWVNESFSDASQDNDYAALRTAWRYTRIFGPRVDFFHNGQWFPSLENSDDQLVKTETGVRVKVNGRLSVDAKVLFDWDQTPADGADKQDSAYIFGLGWDF